MKKYLQVLVAAASAADITRLEMRWYLDHRDIFGVLESSGSIPAQVLVLYGQSEDLQGLPVRQEASLIRIVSRLHF